MPSVVYHMLDQRAPGVCSDERIVAGAAESALQQVEGFDCGAVSAEIQANAKRATEANHGLVNSSP